VLGDSSMNLGSRRARAKIVRMLQLHTLAPALFIEELRRLGLRRASFLYVPGSGLQSSHRALEPLGQSLLDNARDYDRHQAVFLELGAQTGALMGAFLHRTRRGQGIGGVRLWPYASVADFLSDGLRLSRGMGRKNALAGLWWGGGKGVIARPEGTEHTDLAFRSKLFHDYGRFIASLHGAYVTAEDVGTTPADMAKIYEATRFMSCAPPSVGGSGNPSPATARGVVSAMEAALDFFGLGGLTGKTIAMQGVGNVGGSMIALLLQRGVSRVVGADISAESVGALLRRFGNERLELRAVGPGDESVLAEPCDILAPNALGGVLHPGSIPRLRARIVCGAANNQLLDEHRDGRLLAERSIAYVPDFLANRMGIVNCANEQYGCFDDDPAIARHFDREWEGSVYRVTQAVLGRAATGGITTAEAANALADELAELPHPIFPDRTAAIIRALTAEGWATALAPA
jgi:glutamate dehydrogenase/leucine dehydrogenase